MWSGANGNPKYSEKDLEAALKSKFVKVKNCSFSKKWILIKFFAISVCSGQKYSSFWRFRGLWSHVRNYCRIVRISRYITSETAPNDHRYIKRRNKRHAWTADTHHRTEIVLWNKEFVLVKTSRFSIFTATDGTGWINRMYLPFRIDIEPRHSHFTLSNTNNENFVEFLQSKHKPHNFENYFYIEYTRSYVLVSSWYLFTLDA